VARHEGFREGLARFKTGGSPAPTGSERKRQSSIESDPLKPDQRQLGHDKNGVK